MFNRKILRLAGVLILMLHLFSAPPAHAQDGTPTPPPDAAQNGFHPIASALGVALYRKDYPNGSPDFVQVVNLSKGARLELLYGDITETRPHQGSFGGPDPRMTSPALSTFWRRMLEKDKDTFCVVNGGFFYMPEYPTRLAFPLKVNGRMVTEGWGIETYEGEHMMLELWDDHADIQPMTQTTLYASDAPNILGGLSEQANKRAKFAVGRTFLGLDDRDDQPGLETVLILSTQTATQIGAAEALRSLGADKVMMLDGGGSTQLRCQSGEFIVSDRPVPQAVAVVAAKPPPIASQVVSVTDWPVLHVGEGFPLRLEIKNTGIVSWTQESAFLTLKPAPLYLPYSIETPGVIEAGQRAIFTQTLATYQRPGVYPVEIRWGIYYQNKLYPGQTIQTHAVVLPMALQDRKDEFEQALQQWKHGPPEQVQTHLEAWMAEKMETPLPMMPLETPGSGALGGGQIHLEDAIWVPLLMLPIVVILGFIITRRGDRG
jgi:hypothetical protein